MNRLFYIFFGLFFIGVGVYALFSGKIAGISNSLRIITVEENFIEYCIMVSFSFYSGFMLIKKTMFEDKDRPKKGKEKQ